MRIQGVRYGRIVADARLRPSWKKKKRQIVVDARSRLEQGTDEHEGEAEEGAGREGLRMQQHLPRKREFFLNGEFFFARTNLFGYEVRTMKMMLVLGILPFMH